MFFSSIFLGGLLATVILAVPTRISDPSLGRSVTAADVAFDVPTKNLSSALVIPNGLNNTMGVVLLVHGTGSTGNQSWSDSPYNLLLPAKGYAVTWINIPSHALGDAQTSSEYVAYNVQQLAKSSATGQVVVIGHSQGAGMTIQWALLYWPSIRHLVSRYIALAGDFHGTDEGPLACAVEDLLRDGCQASIIQQTTGSNMLNAQNHRGNQSLVPTTSIYTIYDEIIQDEIFHPTSFLPGADNFALQDLDVCGPLHLADHFTMVVDPAAYGIVLLALAAGSGHTPIDSFNLLYCTYFVDDELLNLTALPTLLESAFDGIIQVASGGAVVHAEPLLKQYVCDQGDAPQSQCNSTSVG